MNNQRKCLYFLIFPLSAAGVLWAGLVKAVCPVCTVAVGAGVGLSRWLGIDDTITGTWIGGLIVSVIVWTFSWLDKKGWRSGLLKAGVAAGWYALVIWPLYWQDILGHELNKLAGIDRLALGIMGGSVLFCLGAWLHLKLKQKNGGKSYFPFQKVALPVGSLLILSLVFYFIAR